MTNKVTKTAKANMSMHSKSTQEHFTTKKSKTLQNNFKECFDKAIYEVNKNRR